MRPIWKGAISFGLVHIPITLFPATRTEELRFKMLRKSDHSPINNKRVAEADGKEVPWDEIAKGYEYEKGKFVILTDEDFKRVDIEAARTVNITEFVDQSEVDPIFFYKPYFMEPGKGGEKAYSLLREALEREGKIGIAEVAIRTREHLAGIKPYEGGLIMELMHYCDELVPTREFRTPNIASMGHKELEMACGLIKAMTTEFKPEGHTDDYRAALHKVIEDKIRKPGKTAKKAVTPAVPSNVVDLVAMLKQSLDVAGKVKKEVKGKAIRAPRRKAA